MRSSGSHNACILICACIQCTKWHACIVCGAGAPVRVDCSERRVQTSCVDNGDGSYQIRWDSTLSGTFQVHVTIQGVDVVGSPTPLAMLASKPAVDQFEITGDGLSCAVAGVSAPVSIVCRDAYSNRRVLAKPHGAKPGAYFGIQIVESPEEIRVPMGGEGAKKAKGGGGGSQAADLEKASTTEARTHITHMHLSPPCACTQCTHGALIAPPEARTMHAHIHSPPMRAHAPNALIRGVHCVWWCRRGIALWRPVKPPSSPSRSRWPSRASGCMEGTRASSISTQSAQV